MKEKDVEKLLASFGITIGVFVFVASIIAALIFVVPIISVWVWCGLIFATAFCGVWAMIHDEMFNKKETENDN